jgi:hypothetical protein
MSTTKASRSDVGIHNSLTAFFHLQDGSKTVRQLHSTIIDLVDAQHHVVWVEQDVKSVLRAAAKRGGAIDHEIQLDAKRKERYEEAMQFIAANSQTRTSARRATAQKQPIIDEYNRIIDHKHLALSLAQLALHRSIVGMGEKRKKLSQEKEEEERRMQALIKEHNRAEAEEKSKEKAKKAKETAEKKREAAADKAAKEAQRTRAINTQLAKALVEHNKDRYKRKREEGQMRAEFVKKGLQLMNRELAKLAREVQDEAEEKEDGEENKENIENVMPT